MITLSTLRRAFRTRFTLASIGLTLVFAAGCRDREIVAYQIPKETRPTPSDAMTVAPSAKSGSMTVAPPSVSPPATTGASLLWTAPTGWTVKAGSAMRRGSFAAGADASADISITAFPGDVGGVLPNINRWRGQVGLPPVDETGLAQITQSREINGLKFVITDAAGTANGGPSRIVAALVPWQGRIWFFKLTGSNAVVSSVKPSFLEFVETVRSP
jgi:hypothetical protein